MFRLVILFLLVLLKNCCFGKTPTDSLKSRLNQIETIYQKHTDSLQRELHYYKVKEDYYSDALSDQANRFSLIVGGLLGLAGLISWSVIKYEVVSLRKEVAEDTASIENFTLAINSKSDIYERNQNLSLALAFTNMMRSSALNQKYSNFIFECSYTIDLFSRNYKKAKNEAEKIQDKANLTALTEKAVSVTRTVLNTELDEFEKYMFKAHYSPVFSGLNASIQNIDDEKILEDLHTIKANYKQILEKNA